MCVLVYVFFTDVAEDGVREGRPPLPLWLVSGQKEMVPSVLICLVSAYTQRISLLNAISIDHLVWDGKWDIFQMSTQALLKCV